MVVARILFLLLLIVKTKDSWPTSPKEISNPGNIPLVRNNNYVVCNHGNESQIWCVNIVMRTKCGV